MLPLVVSAPSLALAGMAVATVLAGAVIVSSRRHRVAFAADGAPAHAVAARPLAREPPRSFEEGVRDGQCLEVATVAAACAAFAEVAGAASWRCDAPTEGALTVEVHARRHDAYEAGFLSAVLAKALSCEPREITVASPDCDRPAHDVCRLVIRVQRATPDRAVFARAPASVA